MANFLNNGNNFTENCSFDLRFVVFSRLFKEKVHSNEDIILGFLYFCIITGHILEQETESVLTTDQKIKLDFLLNYGLLYEDFINLDNDFFSLLKFFDKRKNYISILVEIYCAYLLHIFSHNLCLPTQYLSYQSIVYGSFCFYIELCSLIKKEDLSNYITNFAFLILGYDSINKVKNFLNSTLVPNIHLFDQALYKIKCLLQSNKIEVKIECRIKNISSIWLKMLRKSYMVYDIVGVRLLVNSRYDCYYVVSILKEYFLTLDHKEKDFIYMPKSNSYESIHLLICLNDSLDCVGSCIEIQVRTVSMHSESNFGNSSYITYKNQKLSALMPYIQNPNKVYWV